MSRWRLLLSLLGFERSIPPPPRAPSVGLTQSTPPPELADTQPIPLTRRGSGERPCVRPPPKP